MLKKYLHISVCELFEGKAFYFHVQSVFSESYCSQMGCLDFFFFFLINQHTKFRLSIFNTLTLQNEFMRALKCLVDN